jgi:hypothetical protein
MFSKSHLVLLFLSFVSCALYGKDADTMCSNKQDCKNPDNSCQCFCSGICAPRDKEEKDSPIYVENDPEGHYCYCKPWDMETYYERCADKLNDNQ